VRNETGTTVAGYIRWMRSVLDATLATELDPVALHVKEVALNHKAGVQCTTFRT